MHKRSFTRCQVVRLPNRELGQEEVLSRTTSQGLVQLKQPSRLHSPRRFLTTYSSQEVTVTPQLHISSPPGDASPPYVQRVLSTEEFRRAQKVRSPDSYARSSSSISPQKGWNSAAASTPQIITPLDSYRTACSSSARPKSARAVRSARSPRRYSRAPPSRTRKSPPGWLQLEAEVNSSTSHYGEALADCNAASVPFQQQAPEVRIRTAQGTAIVPYRNPPSPPGLDIVPVQNSSSPLVERLYLPASPAQALRSAEPNGDITPRRGGKKTTPKQNTKKTQGWGKGRYSSGYDVRADLLARNGMGIYHLPCGYVHFCKYCDEGRCWIHETWRTESGSRAYHRNMLRSI